MEDLIEAYLSVYEESNIDEGFKRMNRDKIEKQAERLGGDRGDVLRILAAKMDTEAERKYSTSQARKNRAGAGSEYRKAQELRARDDAKADFEKYGLPESADLYDLVLDHLLDEGYADTEDNAITIMANMSEEWIDEIINEAQIMSVSGPGGLKHMINRNVLKLQNAAAKEAQGRKERERATKEAQNAARLDAANKRGIEAATNRSNDGAGGNRFVQGSSLRANERDDMPTDYRARRRRASGR